MEELQKSGLYYPNKLVLATLLALKDVMGKNGLNAILNLARLRYLIDHYPPDNLEKEFDFADFTRLQIAIVDMYGEHGGQVFIKRSARAAFGSALSNYGAMAGVNTPAFRGLDVQTQTRIGLQAMAKIFSEISDQTASVEQGGETFMYTVRQCAQCWQRMGLSSPICFFGAGMLEGGLKWISGGHEFQVNEIQCKAMGDEVCKYSIRIAPIEA